MRSFKSLFEAQIFNVDFNNKKLIDKSTTPDPPENHIKQWYKQNTFKTTKGSQNVAGAYMHYKNWATQNGHEPVNVLKFHDEIPHPTAKTSQGVSFVGMGLKEETINEGIYYSEFTKGGGDDFNIAAWRKMPPEKVHEKYKQHYTNYKSLQQMANAPAHTNEHVRLKQQAGKEMGIASRILRNYAGHPNFDPAKALETKKELDRKFSKPSEPSTLARFDPSKHPKPGTVIFKKKEQIKESKRLNWEKDVKKRKALNIIIPNEHKPPIKTGFNIPRDSKADSIATRQAQSLRHKKRKEQNIPKEIPTEKLASNVDSKFRSPTHDELSQGFKMKKDGVKSAIVNSHFPHIKNMSDHMNRATNHPDYFIHKKPGE